MPKPFVAGVYLRLPDGQRVFAPHGALVGRLASCAVHIDDPGISEAHALVSLRGGAFRLLALRGRIAVGGHLVPEAALGPGCDVQLTPNHTLSVERVQLPSAVLAIEGDELVRQTLPASCALTTEPTLRLWPRFLAQADAWIWSNGAEWTIRFADGTTRPLRDGEHLRVGRYALTTSLLPLDDAGATTLGPSLDVEPLHVEARYDVVHIRRGDAATLTLSGMPARLVSELIALGGTADWRTLAAELWGAEDQFILRRRFDVSMVRLRKKLRSHRVRPDLIRALGTGVVELILHPRDIVVDAS